ncbi:MAG TPA: 6-phospho-3-hexuloisomerase [Methanospirillum sp.]|nr:6-phospho-3-hexuloisomerase [Methanospirillum sp.]
MDECYPLRELMLKMVARIEVVARSIDMNQVECFLTEINGADRIFVTGAGRSGFVAKAFAMRLMHLGLKAYVVGETVTPSLHTKDTMVAFSGSGKTKSILEACETTRKIGGKVCVITGTKNNPMTVLADCLVYLKTDDESIYSGSDHFALRQLRGEHRSMADPSTPLGTLFETSAMVFADSVISALIEQKHCSIEEIMKRYTNMQ